MRKILVLVAAIALAGCATTSGLNPTISKSGFDNATVVNIAPHGGVCDGHCTLVGAQWNSSDPDRAILTLGVLGYTKFSHIEKADLRIDSEVFSLSPNPGLTRLERGQRYDGYRSYRDFTVPLNVIREIVAHKDVWVRVYTSAGMIDDAIIEVDRDSKAYHALLRFLAEVDAIE